MSAPTDDLVDRVLDGELSGVVARAKADLDYLVHVARSALSSIEAGEHLGVTGDMQAIGGAARDAAHSLAKVAVVIGKREGAALQRSVLS